MLIGLYNDVLVVFETFIGATRMFFGHSSSLRDKFPEEFLNGVNASCSIKMLVGCEYCDSDYTQILLFRYSMDSMLPWEAFRS